MLVLLIYARQGLNYNAESMLADMRLRPLLPPISVTKMDWMHNMCVGGVSNHELHAFFGCCRTSLGVRFSDLDAFVSASWQWPSWQETHKVAIRSESGFVSTGRAWAPRLGCLIHALGF